MTEPGIEPQREGAEPALRSLQGELVLLIAEQARRVRGSVLVSCSLVALLIASFVPPVFPLVWLALVAAGTVVRTRLLVRLPDRGDLDDDRKLTVAAWVFALHGALLASVLTFLPWVPVAIGAVLTIFVVGVCAATIHATSGFRRIYLPYSVVSLGPVAAAWLLTPGYGSGWHERAIFAVLALIYIVVMLHHAKGAFQVFSESYAIRLQRIELTSRLREALEQAESANRAKTRFLASASHDLRQPIHALSLFSGSLLLRPLDERSLAIAEQMDKAVKSLASQLDALLDISRLDAGVIDKSIGPLDLHSLLAQLYEEFLPLADRKGLALHWSCPEPAVVRSDSLLLVRILRNLLSNAIKYTERGHIELSVQRLGGHLRVVVADTGAGIPIGEHERIFEEFYQLDNPERDRSKGLGLGLAIVRRLTALLDIRLHLESQPGKGSRFSIDVPAVTAKESSAMDMKSAPEPVSPHVRVLVIDDEEAIRVGMKTLLEEMGFRVRAVASTEAAIDEARVFEPSIVLADFRLRGDDDGMRAIKALRVVWPALPALLISGDTAPDRLREAKRAGLELLHKPVSSQALRESILKAVNA